ncbi:MAG: hypothetical protein K2N74_03605, partial [Clostridiales bacterium]|nr:hypothetical protein [Clostridiales bacterium]
MAKTDKIKSKRTLFWRIFGVLSLCAVLVTGVVFALPKNDNDADAFTGVSVGNIYNETKDAFDFTSLTNLAQAAGYTKFVDMVSAAKSGTVKNTSAFGAKTLKFGSYTTKQGAKKELEWIPVYLSKSDALSGGDAILTLWLAGVEGSNTSSDQEIVMFSDGTHSYQNESNTFAGAKPYTENGKSFTVQASTYDSSYLRHVMLLGDYNYVENFGFRCTTGHVSYTHAAGKIVLPNGTVTDPPALSTLNKFNDFKPSGKFSKYLATPSVMTWQMSQSSYQNDPKFSGTNAASFTTNWTGDSIWLPSRVDLETQWGLNNGLRSTDADTWTRTNARLDRAHIIDVLSANGATFQSNVGNCHVQEAHGLRPAIHLNLSKIGLSIEDTTVEYNGEDFSDPSVFAAAGVGWYNPIYMTVSSTASAIDVGTYTLTVSLTPAAATDELKWMDDTTDPKTFKLTITKKKIGMYAPSVTDEGDLLTGYDYQIFTPGVPYEHDIDRTGATPVYKDTAPEFALEYRKDGTTAWTTTKPTTAGKYYARPYITEPNKRNYEIDYTVNNCETPFTRLKNPVAVPYFTNSSVSAADIVSSATTITTTVQYTGDWQDFDLINDPLTGTLVGVTTGGRTGGLSYSTLTEKYRARNVGEYTVTSYLS